MRIEMFMVGKLLTNCYVAACSKTKEAIIIDPGLDTIQEAQQILNFINGNSLKLKFIVNTHGHPDHTCGNGIIKEKFSVPVLIHGGDAEMLGESGRRFARAFGFEINAPPADRLLHDGDLIEIGEKSLRVMHTPGHSLGSICLIGEKEVFTGDTLFAGSIGRVDFPGSSREDMRGSLRKIAALPDFLIVYPGHGPVTTIKEEKQANPFLCGL